MAEFVMPKLGADMTAGRLIAWRKQPGDTVRRGEIIAEVETDKADIEVEVFTDGVVEQLLAAPGDRVPVGTPLALIRGGEESAAGPASAPRPEVTRAAPRAGESPAAPVTRGDHPPAALGDEHRLRISPAARKLAADLEIDPAAVTGTGPGGRITLTDIEQAAGAREAQPPPPVGMAAAAGVPPVDERQARMRQTIAAAMARSKREIPHYYLSTTIDLRRATAWLAAENARQPVTERLLPGVLLLKATALALREVPELNGSWEGERGVASEAIHLGVAIALRGGGLVAPALHHADRQPLADLMASFRDLVQRARGGRLRSSELSDPTITVTSLGDQGVETVFGVIYPPQVAIVGFGKVVERPWAVDGHLGVHPVVTATLAADHRVSDGHRGGLFLAAVERLLQEPEKL